MEKIITPQAETEEQLSLETRRAVAARVRNKDGTRDELEALMRTHKVTMTDVRIGGPFN